MIIDTYVNVRESERELLNKSLYSVLKRVDRLSGKDRDVAIAGLSPSGFAATMKTLVSIRNFIISSCKSIPFLFYFSFQLFRIN